MVSVESWKCVNFEQDNLPYLDAIWVKNFFAKTIFGQKRILLEENHVTLAGIKVHFFFLCDK